MTKKAEKPSYVLRDIPLDQESGRRHMPVLMGLLVFLLIVVFTAAITIGSALHKWQNPGAQKVTIEILENGAPMTVPPPPAGVPSGEQSIAVIPKAVSGAVPSATSTIPGNAPIDLEKIKSTLKTIPGVLSFDVLDHEKLMLLLQPWVGDTANLNDLKMPILIDVELDPNIPFHVSEAHRVLSQIAPGIRIESHAKWQQTLVILARSLRTLSYIVIAFIALTIFVIVSLMTRASLNVHSDIINVLRLMGARNRYIASYFQNSSFWLCLKGGLMGLIIAIPTVIFMGWLSRHLGMPQFFTAEPGIASWVFIALLPVIIACIAMLVSRLAVIGTLMRLDAA